MLTSCSTYAMFKSKSWRIYHDNIQRQSSVEHVAFNCYCAFERWKRYMLCSWWMYVEWLKNEKCDECWKASEIER